MKHFPNILVLALPEAGHLNPFLPIIRTLTKQKWTVSVLAHPRFANDVLEAGARTIPLGGAIVDDQGLATHYRMRTDCPGASLADLYISEIHFRGAIGPYDLILMDFAIASSENFKILNYLAPRKLVAISTSLPRVSVMNRGAIPLPVLTLCPEDFEIPTFRSRDPNCIYVEPSLGPLIRDDMPQDDENRVVVSFGSQITRLRLVDSVIRAVIAVAHNAPQISFHMSVGELFDDVVRRSSILPVNLQLYKVFRQKSLLEGAMGFVCHGGLGGIKEAVIRRVPVVCVPFMHDQKDNGERIQHHGLGSVLSPNSVDEDGLWRALNSLPQVASSSQLSSMSDTFLEAEKQQASVNFIKTIAGS